MEIFIVEDEELAVKKLQKTLQAIDPDLHVAGTADSIASAVEWLKGHTQPDLILMDIELADGQSFEIFNLIEVKSPVIFTTSYDEFALKAFKVNSVDYLLKPVQKDELENALSKFRSMKKVYADKKQEDPQFSTLVKELQQTLQHKEYRQRFLVKHLQKMVSIEVDRIAYFFSDDRLSFFKTADDKKYVVDYTIDEIENMLDPNQFFRINRAFLVSIKSIDQINDYFGNRLKLNLKPTIDKEALVSREKVTPFKEWMGK
ncbi:MAG: response regulator transcription factor [Saprospiraceae bacterium]|uniref:Response regulator transcription factor n=1 Tax=Candidatus Opimibacter skivensis TaxID=2982028 RepID=A0A9D7XRW3_9BACT|nr:response regulator transcription factor [Candidatus Opimibacter skivensis]